MLAYIKGEITYKTPTAIHLETNGIGYHLNISLNTFESLEGMDRVKMFTHLQVKEDSHTLWGFMTEEEKATFVLLISVSGIGTNTARVILSSMRPDEVKGAILNENVARFSSVKGIGPKTAKRVILDLKDKVGKLGDSKEIGAKFGGNSIRDEAIAALNALGFQKSSVIKKIEKVYQDNAEINQVETLIKLVLKQLS